MFSPPRPPSTSPDNKGLQPHPSPPCITTTTATNTALAISTPLSMMSSAVGNISTSPPTLSTTGTTGPRAPWSPGSSTDIMRNILTMLVTQVEQVQTFVTTTTGGFLTSEVQMNTNS